MKRLFLVFSILCFLSSTKVFTQNVYITQTGNHYHTAKCRFITDKSETIPLWKAKAYGKTPCTECKPPVKETKSSTKKGKSKKATHTKGSKGAATTKKAKPAPKK